MRRIVTSTLLSAVVVTALSACALIPVKPVNQRPKPRVKCETALVFYGNPQAGQIVESKWAKVCSDGKVTPKQLPWYVRLYLRVGSYLN